MIDFGEEVEKKGRRKKKRFVRFASTVFNVSTIEIEWHYLQPACAPCNSCSFIPTNIFVLFIFSKKEAYFTGKIRFVASFASLPSINNEKFVHRAMCNIIHHFAILFSVECLFCFIYGYTIGFNWNFSNDALCDALTSLWFWVPYKYLQKYISTTVAHITSMVFGLWNLIHRDLS